MERAVLSFDNAYNIENLRVRGYLCETNIPSNTAFRGFGAPQSMLVCETWMDHIASTLNISPKKVHCILYSNQRILLLNYG